MTPDHRIEDTGGELDRSLGGT